MQFNSQADNLDIVSDVKFWCGIDLTDTTTYSNKEIARNANFALDRIHSLIIQADGKWRHNDQNDTSVDLIDTSTTISAARKVAIPITWLKVAMVRFIDSAGNKTILKPSSRRNWTTNMLNGTGTGTPTTYELIGSFVYFDTTCSGTLEVQLQKGPSYFDDADTTKAPGFIAQFHRLVSLHSALDYCEVNDMDSRAAKLRNKIGSPPTEASTGSGLERELVNFYATRQVDDQPALSTAREDYGASALID